MEQDPNKIQTTTGDRLSTGLVNAGIGGGLFAGGYAAFSGAAKLFKLKGADKLKFASPLSWKLTGAAAAILGVYGFATADKGKEVAKEKAMADLMDPTKGTEKERSAAFDKQWDAIDKGDLSNLKESTKFRDKISAERAAPSQEASR